MTSFVLLVLTVVHFLVGVFSQNLSCDVLTRLGTGEQPQQRELYDFIDRNVPLTALNPHGVVKDDLVTVSNIVKYVCNHHKYCVLVVFFCVWSGRLRFVFVEVET
jgi:hypothetical protein